MKETFYFSHDYNAAEDEKIKRLIYKWDLLGYGIFWRIIEMLYQNDGVLRTECERIAFELRQDPELIKSIIFDFDLFEIASDTFTSRSVLRRLNNRKNKSQKARKSAEQRWKQHHANALRTQSDGNAIKESKVKESKVNNNIITTTPSDTMKDFILSISEKDERYLKLISTIGERWKIGPDIISRELDKFVNYWCEKTRDGKRERWQTEKVFEVQRRLATWFSNANKFNQNKQGQSIVSV